MIPVFAPVLSANPNISVFKGCDKFPRHPKVHYIVDSSTKVLKIKLVAALGSLSVHDPQAPLLVQFWARTGAGKDVFLLATTNQPYGVYGQDEKLDMFRESCLQQKFFIDLGEDVSFGFPGLVFKTETRQQTRDMNFYNPEDVRPRFGSNAIFPVRWGSFAVPVFLYTEEGNKTPSTCSTAKKKECVGVLEFITTKSMASYEADMDLVEKALERAGFASSAKIDGLTHNSSKKDARTETIEKKCSAAFDSSTQTAIDVPTDAASSYKNQQKTGKRKLEHTAEIDPSTEATSSKKEGRDTQRMHYSFYSCVALCFGQTKLEAMKSIEILLGLKRPVKEATFNSVLRDVGITRWPYIRKKTTSASTPTLPETLINSRAPEIMLNDKRWGKQVVQEQLTSSHSFNMPYLNGAPANATPNMASSSLANLRTRETMLKTTRGKPVLGMSSGSFHMPYHDGAPVNTTPNMASSSLVNPGIMQNTIVRPVNYDSLNNHLVITRGEPLLGTSTDSFRMPYHDGAPANPTPNMASFSLVNPEIMLNTIPRPVIYDSLNNHLVMTRGEPVLGMSSSSESFRMPYHDGAPANPTPNMASSSIVNPEIMLNTIPRPVIYDSLNNHLFMTRGQPVLGTSSDCFHMPYHGGAPANTTSSMAGSSLLNPEIMLNTIPWLVICDGLNNHLVMTSSEPVLGTSSGSFHMPYCGGAPANATENLASSSLIKLRAPQILPNTTWHEPVPEQLTSSGFGFGFNSSYETRINPTVSEIPTGLEPTENAHVTGNTNERQPGRDSDALGNQYDNVQYTGPIYTEDQVNPDFAGTQANETLDLAEFVKNLLSPTSSGIPTENANLIYDTHERQLGEDFNVIGSQYGDAQLTELNHTGDEVMSDRAGAPSNEIAYFDSYSETPNTIWATNTMAHEQVTSHDSYQTPDIHNPGDYVNHDDCSNYDDYFNYDDYINIQCFDNKSCGVCVLVELV